MLSALFFFGLWGNLKHLLDCLMHEFNLQMQIWILLHFLVCLWCLDFDDWIWNFYILCIKIWAGFFFSQVDWCNHDFAFGYLVNFFDLSTAAAPFSLVSILKHLKCIDFLFNIIAFLVNMHKEIIFTEINDMIFKIYLFTTACLLFGGNFINSHLRLIYTIKDSH